jgi:hypothetical protein
MAFLAGLATEKEIEELKRRGWVVEPAEKYNLVGEGEGSMFIPPEPPDNMGLKAVVVFVDTNLVDIMDGPDWEGGTTKEH